MEAAPAWHDDGVTASLSPQDQPAVPEEPQPAAPAHDLRTEVRQSAVVLAAVTVSGLLLGLLWLWLAPRVPLISDGKAVYLRNSEGEQSVGADGVFAFLGLGFGAVSAALVFWFRRSGGIAVVVGLAAGSLLASLIGWRLGVWLGPTSDVAAHARAVGKGVVFDGPLKLGAKGTLLAWPLAAMAVHLGLTALFGPRDPEPVPHWPAAEG